ncbi:MAG TPA: diaminopropionate ammonia-lyase [Solirubrobacteraceae bacterium]
MSDRDVSVDLAWNRARDPAWRPRRGLEDQARALHHALDGYAPTPLHRAPTLAAVLGLGAVLLKDESSRFGLPAFKALGAWWATAWAVADRLGAPALATEPDALRDHARGAPLTLVCATEGNHGRAVARAARWLGLQARVVVPDATTPERLRAIEAEGARVEHVDGDYDAAVRRAASLADDRHLVIADTSWPGYEEVPRRVVEGYATIFAELDGQLDGRTVDLVVVPIGVGSLAAAAARHFRATPGKGPRLVGLEPIDAACVLASARAGHPVTVDGDLDSIMAGLNCPTPSMDAWPQLAAAFDAFCAVGDAHVLDGMRRLAAAGLDRGACAGGVVGGLTALLSDPAHREALALPERATALLVLTEGVTDRDLFAEAVGRAPAPA